LPSKSSAKVQTRGIMLELRIKIFILYPVKIHVVKLSSLLSEFLFSNKQLDLTGIGRFIIDDAGTISFEQNTSTREDGSLVNYITDRSGKMKSLVASDLDSHLEQARQFLNIGKPYLFEGIGILSKNKFGKFDFTQSNSLIDKKESPGEGRDITSTTENSFTDYEEMFSPKKQRSSASKTVVAWLIALAGLSLAVFGGYLVYNRTKNKSAGPVTKQVEPVSTVHQSNTFTQSQDSIQRLKDSIRNMPVDTSSGIKNYRFVIEKATRARAFYRYNNLRRDFIKVQMDTKDSVIFNLYFLLPSLPADTARKRDSLQRLYGTRGRTTVELN
ncbi:MAG TPA: hypothetical protein VFP97_15155, partial [Chitinophagaceae bacterium]|nr:hypothetical protein [Chitinophagaceae bacterium]